MLELTRLCWKYYNVMNVRYSLNERIIFIYAFVLEHPAIFFTFFVYNTKYAIKDLVRHILLTINIYNIHTQNVSTTSYIPLIISLPSILHN